MSVEGYISEVFPSFQGEGIYAGVKQIFVRTSGCSLSCVYCDTEDSRGRTKFCRIFKDGESRDVENPISPNRLFSLVTDLSVGMQGLHSISITGGEPLEQAEFLEPLMTLLKEEGFYTYLETNGLHPEGAERLAPLSDYVALDIKLPSLCGGGDMFGTYRKTIPMFSGRGLFFKVVVADGFDPAEFEEAVRLAGELASSTVLVIQPATGEKLSSAIAPEVLRDCHAVASRYLDDVRIIPQMHRVLGFM